LAIYYHQVRRDERDRFAWQMDHLLRWVKSVRAGDLNPNGEELRRIAVTADDGWLSFVENALPELEKRNIPLTLFIVSHRLGDTFGDSSDRPISESELLNLRHDHWIACGHSSPSDRCA
jgi:peptidoglycan/xylan/chitin deacetylase (PgdA/CDA1 family)